MAQICVVFAHLNYNFSDLKQLDIELSHIIASAWADNTVATRKSQWTKYLKFCAERSLVALPADTQTVARFLTFLARTSKFSTVNNYLSAVIVLHKYHGFDASFRDTFYIQLALKGLRRILGDAHSQSIPLSPEQLLSCRRNMDGTSLFAKACWAAIVLCFRSLLRKANVLPTSSALDKNILRRSDIRFYTWGMMLTVKSTKKIQFKERQLEIPVFTLQNSLLCAVTLIREHWDEFPGAPDSPLFFKRTKQGIKPLTYNDVLGFLKDMVTGIGLDASRVGLHSLRRSGATFLCRIGVPLTDIKCIGDWRSLAVLEYLVTPIDRKLQIESSCVQQLSKLK